MPQSNFKIKVFNCQHQLPVSPGTTPLTIKMTSETSCVRPMADIKSLCPISRPSAIGRTTQVLVFRFRTKVSRWAHLLLHSAGTILQTTTASRDLSSVTRWRKQLLAYQLRIPSKSIEMVFQIKDAHQLKMAATTPRSPVTGHKWQLLPVRYQDLMSPCLTTADHRDKWWCFCDQI